MKVDIGLLKHEPVDAYHAHTAVSHSKLEVFRQRPALYHGQFISGMIPRPDKPAMIFGRALHCLVLEGIEAFEARFAIEPEEGFDRRSNAGKARWQEWVAEHGEREMVAYKDWMNMQRIQRAVLNNLFAAELVTDPEVLTEVTFRTPKLSLGFQVQCRCDLYHPAGCAASNLEPYVLDLKTIEDIDDFDRHFREFGYYRQSPFYRRVISTLAAHFAGVVEPARFYFVGVEKSPPHGCTVFEADAASIALGLREIDADLAQLAECYRSSIWPNAPEFRQVYLPAWYLDRRTAEMSEAARQAEMAAP